VLVTGTLISLGIGYALSAMLNKGGLNERVAAGFLQVIFFFAVPGLCIFAIISHYKPVYESIWFLCWFVFVCIVTFVFIVRTRGKLKK